MTYKVNVSGNVLNFELFFELSPDLLCIARHDGYFQRVNPSVCKVLEYTYEELYAKPIHEFIYEDDRDITARHRSNLIKNDSVLNLENRYVTKSGKIVWLSWTSISVGSEKVVYAIAKNITHKKKLEQDRNQVIANLSRLNHDLKLLTYKTSHDLRSPVSNLLSVFSLMDVSKIQDEETLDFIEMLKSATESLKETLNDYVDVLNQPGDVNVYVSDVSLQESLNAVMQSLNGLILSTKTIIHIDFSEIDRITFNKEYLESIFLNLITNSIKYALPDSMPTIFISSKKIDGKHTLIFADQGQGFDIDIIGNKIFGMNQTFHHHHDSKGIGLYLVYNHVTSLGGNITVESEVNKGAKFTITFKS